MRLVGHIGVVVVWSILLLVLAATDGWAYAIGGGALTVAVGAYLDSTRALAVPALLAGAALLFVLAIDDAGWYDNQHGELIQGMLTLYVVPATIALGLGIVARRALRRSPPPGRPAPSLVPGRPAPPPQAPRPPR